jgi:Ni,Fe-hydrogenase III large subunit
MRGKLPIGPFDTCHRQPILLECELEGARVAGATLEIGPPRRGVARGFEGLMPLEGLELASRICARSSIAHSIAYCQALEEASGIPVETSASAFRVVLGEYERIASHLGVVSDVGRALVDDALYRGPRRYLELIRQAFLDAAINPFGFGMVVPGGAAMSGNGVALRGLSRTWKRLERECGSWSRKLLLSRARLRAARLPAGSSDDTPGAPALRAAGLCSDARSGETAYGYYASFYYRPVVRVGGSALDRVQLLLEEIRSSISVIRKVSASEEIAPVSTPDIQFHSGNGVGIAESPEGAIEHRLFLGSGGKIIRNRVSSTVSEVAARAPRALEGTLYEDIAPALISLYLCEPCLNL